MTNSTFTLAACLEWWLLQGSLEAFQHAYSENPEHYYLANYIKHIQFVLSDEYKDELASLDSWIGTYEGGYVVYKKNGKLYSENPYGGSALLLPMSEDECMWPQQYSTISRFVKENNTISVGFLINLQNEDQTFYKKIK